CATARIVRHIRPALEKHPALRAFMNNVDPAFQPNEIFPGCIRLTSHANECFSALSRTGHQIVARERSMADAARHFDRHDIEIATGTKEGANDGERIAYG